MRLLKIGRDASCDIVMHSDRVSSLHAELTLLNSGDIMLEDKGSRNGTFIMNQQIKPNKPVNVKRGDAIRFADVELQWSQVPMPEDNSAYKGVYGIGSHFNNDFQISGSTVSRYHATVKQGRDGKMYLFDHSKNGTTVDGSKIPSNSPYRIKKSSAVVCGGVPVDLSRLPWPSEAWKYILGIAASVLILVGVGFGVWKFWPVSEREYSDTELYDRYNHSVVMLKGIYHYKVTIGDLNLESLNKALSPYGVYIPQRILPFGTSYKPVPDGITDKDLVTLIDEVSNDKGQYSGTGFFISNDGKLLTNLHVVKPWLEDNGKVKEMLQNEMSRLFATIVEALKGKALPVSLSAYLSQVKVEGVLDYIALVPQGEVFDKDNIKKCKVLSAGDDIREDVALIQMISGNGLPNSCTCVNVTDSLDATEDDLVVGAKVITFGFPHGHGLQEESETLKAFCNAGAISQQPTEFGYMINLTSAGGASGSPIFNNKGMLIGILNSGVEGENFTGAIKAKYIKKLLEEPYKK